MGEAHGLFAKQLKTRPLGGFLIAIDVADGQFIDGNDQNGFPVVCLARKLDQTQKEQCES
nr:hypothetical protein CKG001_04160 [Bdellovibrio sp. CKG001]